MFYGTFVADQAEYGSQLFTPAVSNATDSGEVMEDGKLRRRTIERMLINHPSEAKGSFTVELVGGQEAG
jgi:hypothetical protein